MIVCVSDVESIVRQRQARGLVKRRRRSIRLTGFSRSKQRRDFLLFRIELFDLVIVSVGDQEFVTVSDEAERMLQPNIVAATVDIAKVEQIATDESFH